MEHTSPLTVQVEEKRVDLNIAIHPNEGSDLKLFTLEHHFTFYAGSSLDNFKSGSGQLGKGTLSLLNDCPPGVLQVSEAMASKLAWSEKVMLILEDDKIFLTYTEI
ncbi:hypothetical protein EXM22_01645 [Oceanispirochaeta crateris]|uniref:Uncharacterized protein n=1 Tax=Oceanispirochaeta crateris TaxID=2518645 RepID=A0A5C1QH00_9SPIO|nr:hypothetical protein [Oceanispirochaeta crateris]QEN06757.1 hypothetical protein EXM22_01645 [Oceanispirochaeta crateris]